MDDTPTPEDGIKLARAVIVQALADVGIGSARRHEPPSQSTPEYREAYQCLTARLGTTGEPEDYCPLQAADLFAYEIMREMRRDSQAVTRWPLRRLRGNGEVTFIFQQ